MSGPCEGGDELKRIILLGSTGSIGTQTLDVVRRLPDRLRVVGLSAFHNVRLLHEQAAELALPETVLEYGAQPDLVRLASSIEADIVVVAVAGAVGLSAALAALNTGKDVALATKEALVVGGGLVMEAARRNGRRVLPLDSEHSAIFQCLQGTNTDAVHHLWLTASGGPFWDWSQEQISHATLPDALKHPTWPHMGRKITIDSATMMNKGLETIEAQWLFNLPIEQIGVVVHPQSVVHSLVEFKDGSLISQMGLPDMRLPIAYALLFPERHDLGLPRLDIAHMEQPLTFSAPDEQRFPCLRLARTAAQTGGTMPVVLNAANEAAVAFFLAGDIPYRRIPDLIEHAMEQHDPLQELSLTVISKIDAWTRDQVKEQAHGCTA